MSKSPAAGIPRKSFHGTVPAYPYRVLVCTGKTHTHMCFSQRQSSEGTVHESCFLSMTEVIDPDTAALAFQTQHCPTLPQTQSAREALLPPTIVQ